MPEEKELTGYPSVEKPWLQYYSKEAINTPLPKCTIYDYLWQNNKDHLNEVALKYYGARFTFGELFDKIKATANALISIGVHSGDTVAVCLPSTPESVYIIYALNYIGAIPNMLDPRYNENLLTYCLNEAPARLLLTYDGCYTKFLAVPQSILPKDIVIVSALISAPKALRMISSLKVKTVKSQIKTHIQWKDFLCNKSICAEKFLKWELV